MAEVASAYVSLMPSAKDWTSKLSSAAGDAGTESGRKFGVNFGNLAKRVIAGAAIYKGVSAAAGFAKEAIFGFNSTLQQSSIAFTTMLGSGEKAQAFLGQLKDFAKSTPFEFTDLVKSSQTLLGMGISAKDIIPDLTALGDSVASVGGDSATLNSTILAFGQTMAKGTLDMGNMNQLLQGGMPNALKVLAAQYGVTTGEMVKMISAGKVQSSEALPKLVAGLEKGTSATAALGGMMDKQSQTFSGALSNIGDALTQSIATAFGPFFQATSKGLQGLASWLSGPTFDNLSKMLTTGLTRGMALAGDAFKRLAPIGKQVFNNVLVPAFRAVVAVVPKLVTAVGNLWAVIKPLAKDVAGGLVVGFRVFLAVAKSLLSTLAPITGFLKDNAATVRTLVVVVGAAVLAWKAWTLGIKAWEVVTRIATGVQVAFNAVMDANPIMLVVAAVAALAAGLVYAWKHSETFRAIVTGAFDGIKVAVGAVVHFFTDTIPAAFNTLLSFVEQWGPLILLPFAPFIAIPLLIVQNWSTIVGFFTGLWSSVTAIFWTAIDAIAGFVSAAWETVKSVTTTVWDWIRDHLGIILPIIAGIVFGPVGAIVAYVATHWQQIKDLTVAAWDAIKAALSAVLNAIEGIFTSVWTGIKAAVTTEVNGIKAVLDNTWTAIKTAVSAAWNAVKTTISTVIGGVKTVVSTGIDAVVGFFTDLPGRFTAALSGLADLIEAPFRSAFNAIAHLWNSTVGRISFHIPDWVPKIGGKGFDVPNIPELAQGGIVTAPTVALIGEAGPEAVVPLGGGGGFDDMLAELRALRAEFARSNDKFKQLHRTGALA